MELLVHAGAASTRKDDDGYIAQATAYSAFRGRRVDVTPDGISALPHVTTDPVELPQGSRSSMRPYDSSTFLDNTQLANAALDSQLATSSLDLATISAPSAILTDAPTDQGLSLNKRKRPATRAEQAASSSQKRACHSHNISAASSPDSHGDRRSHSSYLPSPLLSRAAKKRLSDQSSQSAVARDKAVPPASRPISFRDVRQSAFDDRRCGRSVEAAVCTNERQPHDASEAAEVTSELPASYSLSDITSESSHARKKGSESQCSQASQPITNTAGPAGAQPCPPDTLPAHAPVPPKTPGSLADRILTDGDDGFASSLALLQQPSRRPALAFQTVNAVDQQSNTAAGGADRLSTTERKECNGTVIHMNALLKLSTTVKPPEPTTSRSKFTTHVTEPLRSLVEDPAVNSRYLPVSVIRDIHPLERGYWRVDCSPWELSMQIDFWQFIEKTIRRGNAGWGVWCIREDGGEETAASIGLVKVFGWGEIVKHIYLMLWVASKAKVRKLGLQWLDSEETAVVQMSGG